MISRLIIPDILAIYTRRYKLTHGHAAFRISVDSGEIGKILRHIINKRYGMKVNHLLALIAFLLRFPPFNCYGQTLEHHAESINTSTEPEQHSYLDHSQTILKIIPTQSFYGQPVVLSAEVIPTHLPGPIPTGTVQFKLDGQEIASKPLLQGIAKLIISSISASSVEDQHYISAVYFGDESHEGSADSVYLTVDQANTKVSLELHHNPASWGTPAAFIAHVEAEPPAKGTPDGSILFRVDGESASTVPLDAKGEAHFSTTDLPAGDHNITAIYAGNSNYNKSWTNEIQQIFKASSEIKITSSSNPSLYNQAVNYVANVSAKKGQPTGEVQFFIDEQYFNQPVTLDSKGNASITLLNLNAGLHQIRSVYLGDENFDSSTFALNQQVNRANTSTTVTSTANPTVYGKPLNFTTAVTSDKATPIGSLQYKINGEIYGTPTSLDRSGRASVIITKMAVGTYKIEAIYLGNTDYNSSTGQFNQEVIQADTVTTMKYSIEMAAESASLVMTAQVSAVAGHPTGKIQFMTDGKNRDSEIAIDKSGQATLTIEHVEVGDHKISAVFSGDKNYNHSNSENITISVKAPK